MKQSCRNGASSVFFLYSCRDNWLAGDSHAWSTNLDLMYTASLRIVGVGPDQIYLLSIFGPDYRAWLCRGEVTVTGREFRILNPLQFTGAATRGKV